MVTWDRSEKARMVRRNQRPSEEPTPVPVYNQCPIIQVFTRSFPRKDPDLRAVPHGEVLGSSHAVARFSESARSRCKRSRTVA